MLKIENDMEIFIHKICVNLLIRDKNVHVEISVLMLIQEFNNFINIRLIKRNFVLISRIMLINVNMVIFVHLLIAKIKLELNLFIIMNSIKIFTCFITKLNFVLLIWLNMTKHYVSMHIIYKIIVEILIIIVMNLYHAIIGN